MEKYTPIIKQYLKIKKEHQDKILFFRLGDFYEFFFDDAIKISEMLSITLTSKHEQNGKKIPMAGFPKNSSQNHIKNLIKKGEKIAICEQMNKTDKNGLIDRKVIKIITPGTFIDEDKEEKKNNYICSIEQYKNTYGLIYADIELSTINAKEITLIENIINEIDKIKPKEIITKSEIIINILKKENLQNINKTKNDITPIKNYIDKIKKHLKIPKEELIRIKNKSTAMIIALNTFINYLIETKNKIYNIKNINIETSNQILQIDQISRKNLEILTDINGNEKYSLLETINNTSTSMGYRLLKNWLLEPITNIKIINKRLEAVTILKENHIYNNLEELLKKIPDLNKLIHSITTYKIKPIELKNLQTALFKIKKIKNILTKIKKTNLLQDIINHIKDYDYIEKLINDSIEEQPANNIEEGFVIKKNYDKKIDNFKNFFYNINDKIKEYEEKEINNLKIKKLKISYNQKEGYFIDLQKNFTTPKTYRKIKNLSNSIRYKTPELEELERNMIINKKNITEREKRLYRIIIYKIKKFNTSLKNTANHIAILDVLTSFAKTASYYNWTKPLMVKENQIEIKKGRNPIVEKFNTKTFIPNDITLNKKNKSLIITGANMGGKSTYIRQTAIIIILAFIGSYVPADNAKIGYIDKILTRIGANDDLINSCSTFMMEMKEMSHIIKVSTKNSLILIDEIGRGTNYYEGKALAIAIMNYLNKNNNPFILFSTHFNDIFYFIKNKKHTKNIFFKAIENKKNIIFFYKCYYGIAKYSFGINIAKLSGMNNEIIKQSKIYLNKFKQKKKYIKIKNHNIINIIKKMNLNLINPKEALDKLYFIKNLIDK